VFHEDRREEGHAFFALVRHGHVSECIEGQPTSQVRVKERTASYPGHVCVYILVRHRDASIHAQQTSSVLLGGVLSVFLGGAREMSPQLVQNGVQLLYLVNLT